MTAPFLCFLSRARVQCGILGLLAASGVWGSAALHSREPAKDIQEQVPQAATALESYHGELPGKLTRKLHVIYWTPADREPQPQWRERLSRVMETTADFYEKEMKRMGFAVQRLPLHHAEDGLLHIHLVKGIHPHAHYNRESGAEIRRECVPVLRKAGVFQSLDGRDETIMLFCNMSTWDAGQRTMRQNSPYYAGGTAQGGTAWQVDSPLLDPASLPEKGQALRDGQYGRISLGRYNSIFVGGVIHELGHALGLPHNRERPDEAAAFGTALMGSGNRTYGEELRGEGRGTFLTLAHALRLACHPLFTASDRGLREKTHAEFRELGFHVRGKSIIVNGMVSDSPSSYAVVGYSDPEGNQDYNQASASTIPTADGKFELTFDALEPGKRGELMLVACHVNGMATRRQGFHYRVAADGTPNVSAIQEILLLEEVVAHMEQKAPDHAEFLKKLASLPGGPGNVKHKVHAVATRLLEQHTPPTATPLDVPATITQTSLCDLLPKARQVGWGSPSVDRVAERPYYLSSGGEVFERGIYAHAPARHVYALGGKWTTLRGTCGMADGRRGSVVFVIRADGRELWRSGKVEEGVKNFEVPLWNAQELELSVEDAGDGNTSDWGLWLNPELTR